MENSAKYPHFCSLQLRLAFPFDLTMYWLVLPAAEAIKTFTISVLTVYGLGLYGFPISSPCIPDGKRYGAFKSIRFMEIKENIRPYQKWVFASSFGNNILFMSSSNLLFKNCSRREMCQFSHRLELEKLYEFIRKGFL